MKKTSLERIGRNAYTMQYKKQRMVFTQSEAAALEAELKPYLSLTK